MCLVCVGFQHENVISLKVQIPVKSLWLFNVFKAIESRVMTLKTLCS